MTARDDESALVAALKAGDREAFSEVYRRHNAAMVRLAGSILRNRASAEEVTQDAWVPVLRKIDSFDGADAH